MIHGPSSPDSPDPGPEMPSSESIGSGLVGPFHRLDPAHVPASRLGALVTTSILFVLGSLGSLVLWFSAEGLAPAGRLAIILGFFVFVAVLGGLGQIWPRLELAYTRWRVGAEGVEIKRGVLFRHVIDVPRSRIQHTDVAQGPIQRRFGLATLVVHTAGTHQYEINLEGIRRDTALALRDYLLEDRDGDGA